ncbi:MAG: ubiquinol-cytochrome c reductase iron-sulfur subunit [Gammaproteobacteria bacterium]|nr:ubiquinol-cytochrome c reductase iron-sulfur subunit [Gammaproteobacteria bacterium]
MSDAGVDVNRRHFLTVATCVVGGAGAVAAAIPFLASMRPSARAQAAGAPVEVDVSKIEPGAEIKVEWRGRAVAIVRRTPAMLERLDLMSDDQLRDPFSEEPQQPSYAQNKYRSIRPELLVVVKNCTHLGCVPSYRPEVAPEDLGADWNGGYFCPCHGSKFDLSGRVYSGVPAPLNLAVPPYRYIGDSTILIGDDGGVS